MALVRVLEKLNLELTRDLPTATTEPASPWARVAPNIGIYLGESLNSPLAAPESLMGLRAAPHGRRVVGPRELLVGLHVLSYE